MRMWDSKALQMTTSINLGKTDFIRDYFYVDDGLCSVPSEELAVDLIKRSVSLCKKGGIELAKFVCSSSNVLQ